MGNSVPKIGGSKPISFQKAQIFKLFKFRHLEKGQAPPHGKSPTFFGSQFSCERDRQPTIQFTIDLEVPFIYRLIPRRLDFLE
jgi:hypothetical protein